MKIKSSFFFLIVFAISAFALLIAFSVEHWASIKPCILCIYTRWIYMILAGVSLAGCFLSAQRWIWMLFGVVLLGGIGIGAYHLGVEQHWWAGPDKCGGIAYADSLEALRQQMQQVRPRCDEVGWRILGISVTFWNLLLFLGFFFVGMIIGKQNCSHYKS